MCHFSRSLFSFNIFFNFIGLIWNWVIMILWNGICRLTISRDDPICFHFNILKKCHLKFFVVKLCFDWSCKLSLDPFSSSGYIELNLTWLKNISTIKHVNNTWIIVFMFKKIWSDPQYSVKRLYSYLYWMKLTKYWESFITLSY